VISRHGLSTEKVEIHARGLSPEEAIGDTGRKDFPLLKGREVLLQAEYRQTFGQAFTDSPSCFKGTLRDIMDLDIIHNAHDRGLFIAALNAVLRSLSLAEGTVHCRGEEPELCAASFVQRLKAEFQKPKIAVVGFQPALVDFLSWSFEVRVLDLDPENIGNRKGRVLIEDGKEKYSEVIFNWADLVICTGSTASNGSLGDYVDIGKEVIFYGTTIAGTAALLGLKRWCFRSH
jgi:uncharacterized protein (DUF4213/DUF364 family)